MTTRDPATTRIDASDAGTATRLDEGGTATRLDRGGAEATARAGTRDRPRPHRSLFNLPTALAEAWRIVEPIPAGGAEAELFVVARIADGVEAVAKIYRPGLKPRSHALERLGREVARHVVPVWASGESDGLAWEVMEYCRHGSLRPLLATMTGDTARIETVLAEIVPALDALHAAGMIHRDLKPENVLVRSIAPLDLVLADFGIASISDGTQHFTSTSRTVRYAAPEAMTGVISAKADWWSLGMILLEALVGRHPFEGLSEAVVNHQVVTRPVDATAVRDPAWRALVRGLLVRDPARRWGGEEVRRWLARDPTFDRTRAPVDEGVTASGARPYEIENERCTTPHELGIALVRHWAHGVRDFARGFVTAWIRDELRDQNLLRFVHDLADDTRLTPDRRLLAFALRVVPDLPLVWKGTSLAEDAIAVAAIRALGYGDDAGTAAAWLSDLWQADVPSVVPAGHPERAPLVALLERWKTRIATFEAAHARLMAAEQADSGVQSKEAGFANMDELMFGRTATKLDGIPVPHAALLAADLAPEALGRVRARATELVAEVGIDCGWILSLGAPAGVEPEVAALIDAAGPRARAFAARQREVRALRAAAAEASCGTLQRELDTIVRACRAIGRSGATDGLVRQSLREQHTAFLALHARSHEDGHAGPAWDALRRNLQRASMPMLNMVRALDRMDRIQGIRDEVFGSGGPALIGLLVVLLFVFRSVAVLELAGIAGVVGVVAYFWTRASALDAFEEAIDRLPRPAAPKPGPDGR
jgi:hypothetical protein